MVDQYDPHIPMDLDIALNHFVTEIDHYLSKECATDLVGTIIHAVVSESELGVEISHRNGARAAVYFPPALLEDTMQSITYIFNGKTDTARTSKPQAAAAFLASNYATALTVAQLVAGPKFSYLDEF